MSPSTRMVRRLGVIDIGSNSVRFVVYHIFGSSFTSTYNEKVLAGLGRNLRETGRLSPDGKAQTLAALKRFRRLVDTRKLSPVMIAATAAMRVAEDAEEFRQTVLHETGFDISPVSGTEEARLAALGVLAGEKRAEGLACDLGGASLEIVPISEGQASEGISLNLGPFSVVGDDLEVDFDPDANRSQVREIMSSFEISRDYPTLHLVGGAWRNLMLIHQARTQYPLRILQSYPVDPHEAMAFCRWAYGEGRTEVTNWSGISDRRRETLPYGALVLEELIRRFEPGELRVSATGLREGLVRDATAGLSAKRSALVDGCRDLARGNLQAEGFAKPLGRFLAPISEHLPSAFASDNEARLREAARHLAGMGRGLHPDYRAELVFENVLYAPISNLDHEERAYLAYIMHASLTGQNETSNEPAMERLLSDPHRHAARVYGAAIRLAVAACGRASALLDDLRLSWDDGVVLHTTPGADVLLGPRVEHRLGQLNALLQSE